MPAAGEYHGPGEKMRKIALILLLLLVFPSSSGGVSLSPGDEEFLDMVQRQTFNYFLECTNRENGLVMDRAPNFEKSRFEYAPATIAGVGFGLCALGVGAERGWISKPEAETITLTTLKSFYSMLADTHGFFYHFVDMRTGERVWECEISSVDTALFLGGVIFAMEYYENPVIKMLAERLYRRVNWQWMTNNQPFLCMGYKPESGFLSHYWSHYAESTLMYVMALGSPTYPISPDSWEQMARPRGKYRDFELIFCPPLFTHQYSHIFIDFRDRNDGFADYFHNSVQATLANRQFCIDSAGYFRTFNQDCWGLTASIGPDGYRAYGAAPGTAICDGTVAPTAAGASIIFTPEESLRVLKFIYGNYNHEMWGRFGFADSFNLDRNWFAGDAYAINQGPLFLMIENLRTGFIWKYVMKNRYIRDGMKAAGFVESTDFTLDREKLPFMHSKSYFLDERPVFVSSRIGNATGPQDLDFGSPGWSRPEVRPLVLDRRHLQSGRLFQPEYRTETRILHNDDFIFMKVIVRDRDVRSSHSFREMPQDDAVEIYLDSENDGLEWGGKEDFQIVLSPAASLDSLRMNEFFQNGDINSWFSTSYRKIPGGYEFIVSVPRKKLNIEEETGFSVAFHNVDGPKGADCKFNWFFAEPGIWLGTLKLP